MKVLVTTHTTGCWHYYLRGKILDVEPIRPRHTIYKVVDTPHNQTVLTAHDMERARVKARHISDIFFQIAETNEQLVDCLRKEHELWTP